MQKDVSMNRILFFFVFFNFFFTPSFSYDIANQKILVEKGTQKLKEIHSKLKLLYGNFSEEYPEQLMVAMFLPSNSKVLELGANIGRNSCVIASILDDSKNLVSLESCKETIFYLTKNRNKNRLHFNIENAALSKVPLIQNGWISIPSTEVLPGYFKVNTITFDQLQNKYKMKFDTLVVDCEGALYYILKDAPEILKDIQLIIIENDFTKASHYQYVFDLFKKNGFEIVFNEKSCWGENGFYQVWKK
jgi:FkbM family methyltransferase